MAGQVLILTTDGDSHGHHVAQILADRGADAVQFDPARFPVQATLNVTIMPGGEPLHSLAIDERKVDLDRLQAVWFRRLSPTVPRHYPLVLDPVTREYIEGECSAFSIDVWDSLRCRAVPGPFVTAMSASRKLYQLVQARKIGFESPPTLITTDPEEFLDFYCAHDGKVITKPLEHLAAYRRDEDFRRLTELVSTRDIGYVQSVKLCPIIVQPYVPKVLELRVTVVGKDVFAAEIHSQESNRARLDWRRYDMRMTPHTIHRLPDEIADRCLALVERLGLCYGAIDLILDPDGRYVFLEINPDGQYLWIEQVTGLPISNALCDLLLAREPALLTIGARPCLIPTRWPRLLSTSSGYRSNRRRPILLNGS